MVCLAVPTFNAATTYSITVSGGPETNGLLDGTMFQAVVEIAGFQHDQAETGAGFGFDPKFMLLWPSSRVLRRLEHEKYGEGSC